VKNGEASIVMNDDRPPFKIHSPSRITLTTTAREMAKMHGMSEEDLARHLLEQDRLRQAGETQQVGES
jgi:hypothetical protein